MTPTPPSGDDLVQMLAALANPTRLRIVARLAGGRDYVSHLAREIGISRPLLHMHLQRLEAAGRRRIDHHVDGGGLRPAARSQGLRQPEAVPQLGVD